MQNTDAPTGVSGVIHVSSDTSFSSDPNVVITNSIAGALNALDAAAKAPSIKRFVLCSSIAAAVSPANGRKDEITSESWNMEAFCRAWEPPPDAPDKGWQVYMASKMQIEQAVWKWYRDRRPSFTLNAGTASRPSSAAVR